jgi:outer membrane receptor for ferrienterochelin and colicins
MLKKSVLVMLTALLIIVVPVSAQENVLDLDEVVVTASRYEESIMETPVSIEVLDQEEIEESSARNLAELINSVTGVRINNHGGPAGQKTISLRGSDASQVLILLDGQPINSSQNGQIDLAQILLSNVKKVEVLKGPASAVYGANALGGVVNVITKSGSDQEGLKLDLGVESFNTYKTALNYGMVFDNYQVMITSETLNSDGFRDNPDNSGIEQYFLSTKVNYDLDKNRELIFDLSYNESDKEVPGSITWQSPNAIQDDKFENYKLRYNYSKEKLDREIEFFINKQDQIYDTDTTSPGESEHNTEKRGINFKQVQYFNNNTLSYGLEYIEDEIESNENGKHEFDTKSLFLNNKWSITKKVILNTGIRYDNHKKFGSETSPRVGLTYSINNNNNIYLSAGESYRTPTFNDLYWPYSSSTYNWETYITEGNPDLEAETSDAYEIGYRNNYNNFSTEINIFRRNSDNLIHWTTKETVSNTFVTAPSNVDEAETDGLELNLSKNITNNLTLGYSHTYLDSRNVKTNELLKDQYYNDISLSYKPENYKLIFNLSHVGGRIDDLDNYTVCDLSFSKTIKVIERDYEIKLTVNNLFDQDYQVVDGYPMPGRNFMVNLSTKF